MERCSSCSAEIPAPARFCPDCGAPRPVSAEEAATRTSLGPPPPHSPPHSPSHPSLPSDSIGGGRFIPGTMLAGRYRVFGLIGKGGMGEVYRADDVKLGQAVALKFLPEEVSQKPERLARFFTEVRTARQVTHPNVCRVYDIDEVEGQQFISMEYVDGEDLSTLLRRIGRLPKDKAVQMARQLCAGLAAAHDQGILHRDLKPANVMIDGRGRVKITDFGLAGIAASLDRKDALAGTPAYMAPEQLAGGDATVRSDVYALGLVLYEIFTGKRAFRAKTATEMIRLKSETSPTHPSQIVEGFDPAVERILMRCVERDPAARPASALAVAAALPGGDPLAAALEAGETPAPELVAAAGASGSLRPGIAVACLVFVLASMGLFTYSRGKLGIEAFVPLDKHPVALAEQGRQILADAGYTDPPVDREYRFFESPEIIDHIQENDDSPARWERLRTHRPSPLLFNYRESPRPMLANHSLGWVRSFDPPMRISGMANLDLDGAGRLQFLLVIPPQRDPPAEPAADPDWSVLFEAAELNRDDFTAAEPEWLPEAYCDRRAAWTGTYPDQLEPQIRVEACAYRGRPVYFEIRHPWDRPHRMQEEERTAAATAGMFIMIGLSLSVLIGALLLARRNLRLGRGDRRGAFRVAALTSSLYLIGALLQASHIPGPMEINLFMGIMESALFEGVLIWLVYLALEPFVRRHWAQTIVAWSRVLEGRFGDPLVGRNILFGAVCGAGIGWIFQLSILVDSWMGTPLFRPSPFDYDLLTGTRWMIAELILEPRNLILNCMFFLFVMVLLRFLLGRFGPILAIVLLPLGVTLIEGWPLYYLVIGFAFFGLFIFCVYRFGLVAAMVAWLVGVGLFGDYPITLDFSQWYAPAGFVPLFLAAALVVYGFYRSLAGQALFREALQEEEAPTG